MQWNEIDYSRRLAHAEAIAAEGMVGVVDRENYHLIYGRNKKPMDLRDFSEGATALFRDGKRRAIIRQKYAPKPDGARFWQIKVTPELNSKYLRMLETGHS